jgi:LmbE family N-acetylglucosaminyl deacetylase
MGDGQLTSRVAILSPHLDDAVLSLGATIAHATARGAAEVRVVTIFGGDPQSRAAAGSWDQRAHFATAGDAARARRDEDRRACELVGASSVVLPFSDKQYRRDIRFGDVWPAVEDAVHGCDAVVVPGFPLAHEDHAWCASLFWSQRIDSLRAAIYVEQPYALQAATAGCTDVDRAEWVSLTATPIDRVRKFHACCAYESQIPLLGGRSLIATVLAAEARHGERMRWVT